MRTLLALILMTYLSPDHVVGDDRVRFPGDGFVGNETRHVHDPTILQAGNRFFCFSTSGNGFGALRVSRDLHTWQPLGPVLPETPAWLIDKIPHHRSLWAPDILTRGERVRMYYSASEKFGQNTSYIGVAECERFDPDAPTKGWRDLGLVIESRAGESDFNAIDPETIRTADGREWMFYGSYWSGIYVAELDPATGKLLKDRRALVATNRTHPHNAIEAPAVIFHDGYYYLFNSYGLAAQGVQSTYRIGVGRSRSVTGPYVDRDGKPMIEGGHTIVLNTSPPMYGPGHCDVLTLDNGRALLAHHFYDGREKWGQDRYGLPTLHVRELMWDTDGWPLPGQPIGYQSMKHESVMGRWVHQVDFAEPREIVIGVDATIVGTALKTVVDGERLSLIINSDRNYYVGRDEKGRVVRGARLGEASDAK